MNYVDLSVFVGTLLDLSYHARYLMKRVEADAIALNPVRLLPTGETLGDDALDNCATAVVHVVFLSLTGDSISNPELGCNWKIKTNAFL